MAVKILDRTQMTQSERVLERFGGAQALHRVLNSVGAHRDRTCIRRWTYPKSRGGTGGLIPASAWPDILRAAAAEGIILTPEDTDPMPRPGRPLKRRHDMTTRHEYFKMTSLKDADPKFTSQPVTEMPDYMKEDPDDIFG